MRFKRLACAASVAMVAGLLMPATPAAAAPAGVFALWLDPNFQGPGASFDNHARNYTGLVYAGTSIPIDNSASSAANYDTFFRVIAFRDPPTATCDRTAPLLLFLARPNVTATASWFYGDLAAKGFDNTISAHCFV